LKSFLDSKKTVKFKNFQEAMDGFQKNARKIALRFVHELTRRNQQYKQKDKNQLKTAITKVSIGESDLDSQLSSTQVLENDERDNSQNGGSEITEEDTESVTSSSEGILSEA